MITTETPTPANSLEVLRKDYVGILEKYLPPELKHRTDPVSILEVGCGFAADARAFAKNISNIGQYLGIDIDPGMKIGAELLNDETPGFVFKVADATRIESFRQQQWDLIILRNPQIRVQQGRISPEWQTIFQNCYKSLKDRGYIFITTPSIFEMKASLDYFMDLGLLAEVVPVQDIEDQISSEFPLKEGFLAIIQKLPKDPS